MSIPLITTAIIGVSLIMQAVRLLVPSEGSRGSDRPFFLLLAGAALLLSELAVRSMRIKFFALTTIYESLVLFSAFVLLVLFFYRVREKDGTNPYVVFGGSLIVLGLEVVLSTSLLPADSMPPVPALQSVWLVLHIALAFAGEAFFTLGFIAAVLSLLSRDAGNRRSADRLVYRTIAAGYGLYTLGALIFGSIWAYFAWGRFWSWDPKETWALVTWLVYTVYLHLRVAGRLRGTAASVAAIAGFIVTVFTFLGVNYLLSGNHRYV